MTATVIDGKLEVQRQSLSAQPPGVEVKGWLNEAALANIEPMSVTFEVSHELRFWLNDVAPLKV